jgi:S-layer family protein
MGLAAGEVGRWLVHAFPDISTNLIAAAIGGALVWSATNARRRLRLVRARRFWRALGGRHPLIVLGAHSFKTQQRWWHEAGVVGMGDIEALVEIEAQLRKLGFSGTIAESKQLSPRDLRSDLVLIGGPVANAATRTMMAKLNGVISYDFTEAPEREAAVVQDLRHGRVLMPQYDDSGLPTTDYALIIRTSNPLAPDTSEIVIIAGSWEHGTAAAAEKLGERKFLRKLKGMKHFETLVETTVVNNAHYNTKVVETRRISAS